jgi:hypothetical protein
MLSIILKSLNKFLGTAEIVETAHWPLKLCHEIREDGFPAVGVSKNEI